MTSSRPGASTTKRGAQWLRQYQMQDVLRPSNTAIILSFALMRSLSLTERHGLACQSKPKAVRTCVRAVIRMASASCSPDSSTSRC